MGSKRKQPYPVQRVFHWVGKAIHQFEMINHGDKILVGVSGVDSLCLLWILRERLKWIPVKYKLRAIFIDPGFKGNMSQILKNYLEKEAYDFEIINTDIGLRAHGPENR